MGALFAVGIDVAAAGLHVVGVDRDRRVVLGRLVPPDGLTALFADLDPSLWVAIDAPDRQRPPLHAGDESLAPKFRRARCAEIALGSQRGFWVPWVTPAPGDACPAWMLTGFQAWRAAENRFGRGLEVYPYAAFRVLAGVTRLEKKQTVAGLRQRMAILEGAGLGAELLELWSHDALDAAMAALVARAARLGLADRIECTPEGPHGHDDSAIWLPRASPERIRV